MRVVFPHISPKSDSAAAMPCSMDISSIARGGAGPSSLRLQSALKPIDGSSDLDCASVPSPTCFASAASCVCANLNDLCANVAAFAPLLCSWNSPFRYPRRYVTRARSASASAISSSPSAHSSASVEPSPGSSRSSALRLGRSSPPASAAASSAAARIFSRRARRAASALSAAASRSSSDILSHLIRAVSRCSTRSSSARISGSGVSSHIPKPKVCGTKSSSS